MLGDDCTLNSRNQELGSLMIIFYTVMFYYILSVHLISLALCWTGKLDDYNCCSLNKLALVPHQWITQPHGSLVACQLGCTA